MLSWRPNCLRGTDTEDVVKKKETLMDVQGAVVFPRFGCTLLITRRGREKLPKKNESSSSIEDNPGRFRRDLNAKIHFPMGRLAKLWLWIRSHNKRLPLRPHWNSCQEYETVHYRPAADITVPDLVDEDRRGTTVVELVKQEGCSLGLTISGGVDKGTRPQLSNLRPGSIAHRCDALEVGNYIISVNNIKTMGLRHEEIVNLLKNAGEHVLLEVEYELPETALQSAFSIQCKQTEIILEKEGNSFGFTIRGGLSLEKMKSRPLSVTSIRPGGPADRQGSLKVGDRIIAINGYNVVHLCLSETMALMQESELHASILVEYDVSVMAAVQNATGPLLVEIEKNPGAPLGITLSQKNYQGRRCIYVEIVEPMGIADRSGAIHVGDHLLSIDGAGVDHMFLAEASQLLRSGIEEQIRLEIIPVSHIQQRASREAMARKALLPAPCMPSSISTPALCLPHSPFNTLQTYNTMRSTASSGPCGTISSRASSNHNGRSWTRSDRKQSSSMSVASTSPSVLTNNNQVCHAEIVEVILYHDSRGPGLVLGGGVFSTAVLLEPPIVTHVEPRSAADRSGVIQEGDRVLSINGHELQEKTLEEANLLLKESNTRCLLEIEFDVAESVLPSSGTFIIKLPKKPSGLGITINAPNKRKLNEPLIITDIRKGSIANRCGSLQPGDKLLAINDVRTENCSTEDASNLLLNADDIIKLKLRREDPYGDEENDDFISYTVELQKRGGVLGVTISGTDSPLDPIVISALTEGGLARRTGAVHIGDRLLGINGHSTKGKTLTEAIQMLQAAGDVVTLKISRSMDSANKNLNYNKRGPSTSVKKRYAEPCYFNDKCSTLNRQLRYTYFREFPREKLKTERVDFLSMSGTPIPSVDSALESWDSSGLDTCNKHRALVPKLEVQRTMKSATLPADFRDYHHSTCSFSDAEQTGDIHGNTKFFDEDWDAHSSQSYGSSEAVDEWSKTCDDLERTEQSEMLQQIGASLRQRSIASLHRSKSPDSNSKYKTKGENCHCNHSEDDMDSVASSRISQPSTKKMGSDNIATFEERVQTIFSPTPIQLYRFKLVKEKATIDFGFSLSDGMYEKGVYVSAVRPGSLADRKGLLSYDRILQVNNVKVRDFDCCLAVPLIAEAGNSLDLMVSRNPLAQPASLESSTCEENEEECYKNTVTMSMKQPCKPV